MATSYKNPTEAATGLGSAFNPTGSMLTPTQIAAINKAASLVPITPSAIAPSTPITLPQQKPDTTNYQRMVAGGNATVGANNTTLTSTNQPSLDKSYQELLTSLGSVTSADQYNTDYNASGIASSQSDFNAKQQSVLDAQSRLSAINAQLAGITAEGQVSNIKSEGRQVPTFVIAGEQAQQNREYAIKALPLQAQALGAQAEVAAAQGNAALSQSILQQAQDHLDKVFQIHLTDSTNLYNYNKDLRDKVFEFATKKEQAQLNALQKADDQKFQIKRDAINNAQSLAKTAIENGQGDVAAKIGALNPDSPDFQNNLATLTAQLRAKPTGAGATPTSYKEWQLAGSPGTFADWLKEQNVKAPTVAQQTVSEYAARLEQANPTIEALEKKITGMNILSFTAQVNLPAALQTSTIQQYMQAARNFINAKLRRESGAVIANSEFIEARQQYLPQP